MALTIRPIELDEVREFRRLINRVFGGDLGDDPDGDQRLSAVLPVDRTCAAYDGDAMVATSGTFPLRMTVPGGTAPVAGLTVVTVSPTHRRRGALTAMMAAHLDGAAARGDAISALWASEASIYGRFGYGIASEYDDVTIADCSSVDVDRAHAGDDVSPVADDELEEQIPPLYAALRTIHAGTLDRNEAWWRHRHFHDPPERRAGASKRRYVIARRDGVATGYLCYRQRPRWDAGLPAGTTELVELLATDARAEGSLVRFAVNVDLHPKLTWWNAPVDASLPWIASNYRRVVRRRSDGLWLRICDVAGALTARTYAADGALTLAVADCLGRDLAGTYALRVDDGRATCTRTDAAPELHVDTATLGSLYFGGVTARHLARLGQIQGTDTAVATADRLFSTPRAPWCAEIF